MNSIAIIGGGAAGMMAAMIAKVTKPEANVMVFDKNPGLGAKVIISGGGRCNVTTGYQEVSEILNKYPRGARFLKHAMYEFGPTKVYEWFEKHGVPLKVEKDMRVFPISDDGHDIVGVFKRFFAENGVTVLFGTGVREIVKDGDGFILTDDNGETYGASAVIVTTGGQAYRHTGSTGDGYSFAEGVGHSITELGPSLTSFVLAEPIDLAGVSHTDVGMKVKLKDGSNVDFRGPFVWTHKGVSGPAVFAMSAYLAFEPCTNEQPTTLFIDFIPSLNPQEFEDYCFDFVKKNPKKKLLSVFHEFIPRSVIEKLLTSINVSFEIPCNEVGHSVLRKCAQTLKGFPVDLVGRGSGVEFVTAGGVSTKEVDPKTMESRICPGLFFAGEVLDIDGFTGGYNLQASWATGYLAGLNSTKIQG